MGSGRLQARDHIEKRGPIFNEETGESADILRDRFRIMSQQASDLIGDEKCLAELPNDGALKEGAQGLHEPGNKAALHPYPNVKRRYRPRPGVRASRFAQVHGNHGRRLNIRKQEAAMDAFPVIQAMPIGLFNEVHNAFGALAVVSKRTARA
jgi:hypothetical protein